MAGPSRHPRRGGRNQDPQRRTAPSGALLPDGLSRRGSRTSARREEPWGRGLAKPSVGAGGEEGQDVAALLARRVRHRHEPLGELIAPLTLRAERALAPQHELPELALRV